MCWETTRRVHVGLCTEAICSHNLYGVMFHTFILDQFWRGQSTANESWLTKMKCSKSRCKRKSRGNNEEHQHPKQFDPSTDNIPKLFLISKNTKDNQNGSIGRSNPASCTETHSDGGRTAPSRSKRDEAAGAEAEGQKSRIR